MPELVWCRRLVAELICSLHHDEGWAGDQIAGLEQPIVQGFRPTISAVRVRRRPRSFSITRIAFSRAAATSSLAWMALSEAVGAFVNGREAPSYDVKDHAGALILLTQDLG
jgi:hypothetical protein